MYVSLTCSAGSLPAVLDVAGDLYAPTWFRRLAATDISPGALSQSGLPETYDVILMSGNVPSFPAPDELRETFAQIAGPLDAGGIFVIGTISAVGGGPADQDVAAAATDLTLSNRFSDWHLSPFRDDSPWSDRVCSKTGTRDFTGTQDGIFILPS